jgi:hypothetical protein
MPDRIHVFVFGGDDNECSVLLELSKLPQDKFVGAVMRSFDSIGKSATHCARKAFELNANDENVKHYLRLASRCISMHSLMKHVFVEEPPANMDPTDDELRDVIALLNNAEMES